MTVPELHNDTDSELVARLRRLGDYSIPFALRTAGSLGVFDGLADGSLGCPELAELTGTDPRALRRLLRALALHGILAEPEPDRFELTEISQLLCHDHPFSLADAYVLSALEVSAWTGLAHSVRTGKAAFEHVHGVGHRRYRAEHPEEDARMDRAHRAASRLQVLTLIRVFDWSAAHTVVDVGAGTGAFLAGVLSRFKQLRGVLFDLPQMVGWAEELVAESGVADRCECVAGDFFDKVPPGADIYVLKSVLGGWDDDKAHRIMCTVRDAMREDSRVLIIEPVMQHGANFTMSNIVHLQSLVLYGGPDRTREDYDRLFEGAGLRIDKLITRATLPVLELVRR